jgi:hypothetical protein
MTEVFHWDHPGLNWAHFHSLANLLSLRNGGQAEPAALFDNVLEQDWEVHDEEEDDLLSLNTALVNQLSDSGHGRLKERFWTAWLHSRQSSCLLGHERGRRRGYRLAST